MNLLRRLLGDRRIQTEKVKDDRRGSLISRSRAVSDRLDRAIHELGQTVTMSREEVCEMISKDGECPILVDNHVSRQVQFDTFADICKFRYSPENSLMRLCRHPEHEGHKTGIAPCQSGLCPKLPK